MAIQPIGASGLPPLLTTTLPQKESNGDVPVKQSGAAVSAVSSEPSRLASTPSEQSDKKSQPDSLSKAIQKLNDFVSGASSSIVFSADKDTNEMVVKVIDTQTKDVIRQFPSEEALQLAKALDKLQGLLVREKA